VLPSPTPAAASATVSTAMSWPMERPGPETRLGPPRSSGSTSGRKAISSGPRSSTTRLSSPGRAESPSPAKANPSRSTPRSPTILTERPSSSLTRATTSC
jgi:hypothetical protein